MRHARIFSNGFKLTFDGPMGRESLGITETMPQTTIAQALFYELGLMHLIAPYLPRVVSADFPVSLSIRKLIAAMYRSEGRKAPDLCMDVRHVHFASPRTDVRKVAIAYSAGKDSLWNMWWAQEEFGADNVLAVHCGGLNRANAARERSAAQEQQRVFPFKHLAYVHLRNGSRNSGYAVMRSRDMFLAGVTIPHALEFGASKIVMEGFSETCTTEPFAGQAKNMRYFNRLLNDLGIPVEVAWKNREEMDVVRDLFVHRPNWVPHVCNCFLPTCYQGFRQRYWQERAPTFTLYDSQCGSCVKCRFINIGRILYDPSSAKIASEDVRAYLVNTVAWVKINREKLADMIGGSFMRDLKLACAKHQVSFLSAM